MKRLKNIPVIGIDRESEEQKRVKERLLIGIEQTQKDKNIYQNE